jgi:hypothetical protein
MLNSESIGLRKLNIPIFPAEGDIRPFLRQRLLSMVGDVHTAQQVKSRTSCQVLLGDARDARLKKTSVDFVITSPPYLNRNNYIAQQKAELSVLSLINDETAYRDLVKSTFRSHTDADLSGKPTTGFPEVITILNAMRLNTGNNSKIPHMVAGYFEDLAKTLASLAKIVKRGGLMAFVVGNTRWGGVVVPVDHLLMLIGEKVGFEPVRVLVTRLKGNSPQQMRQFGRIPVRESIVIMKKS